MIIKEVVIIVKLVLKNPRKLLALIVLHGFNQSQYAKHIGIDKGYFNAIIRRHRDPAPTTARKIVKGIDKSIPDIFLVKTLSKATQKK